ncbi:helix-turn-helix domain-containing protein [Streptomyces johnsoniae]|uniref:MerR family transcriptional regulator n=1 Tax=Streptomyces johnsoniae TaxID=3075532 RepID=A0ABU2S3V9_9ACTN|nr:MerR family transcriptional regulator [Streptomyces sp. DSM 41886]MDT0443119.1 MerR family transcriptional regulator [Streptomyces sp. DSM 41886]
MTDSGVTIGEAAALYGVAPSTLRWWERQGVLRPPARAGGRRSYAAHDLRRIGLAYLCCVTGTMPLDRAAIVTSGRSAHTAWQETVREQIARLDREAEQLMAARAYLEHLLGCTDDDPAAHCPVLDGDLAAHTPRGRVSEPGLTAAARAARAHPLPARRDGSRVQRGEKTPQPAGRYEKEAAGTPECPGCGGTFTRAPRGRSRTYCSPACRQRAYRARAARRRAPGGVSA